MYGSSVGDDADAPSKAGSKSHVTPGSNGSNGDPRDVRGGLIGVDMER